MEFLDFHVHTQLSDGMRAPDEVLWEAERFGVGTVALTDHNITYDLADLRRRHPDLTLVQGSEISCSYTPNSGKPMEVHVVALGIDPYHPRLTETLRRNRPDRRPYLEAILARLADCNIHIGTYEDLQRIYWDSRHVGRCHVADRMVKLGYCATTEEAFDEYIGSFGRRLAYVEPMLDYISLPECVETILASGGVPILAHLFYYRLDDAGNHALLRCFRGLTGDRGGMETSYSRYAEDQRAYLRQLADSYGLLHSAGSDYHGKRGEESLDCRFPREDFLPLLEQLGLR